VLEAASAGVENFFIVPGHKLVIPAMRALLASGDVPIDGFLCPGHVSVVIGADAYKPITEAYQKPCVVAGFEARNMLEGIAHLCRQIVDNEARVENVYPAAVHDEGNAVARDLVNRVFEPADETWRAMGVIPQSGLALREEFRRFDARESLGVSLGPDVCPPGCRCGDVIQGKLDPDHCALFGNTCTPLKPVGPCMVSSEGACAAWYKYNRKQ
jgi:hydrogenase expression/formation protein HypD